MSQPSNEWKYKLNGSIHELMSAMSSLNMEPSPIPFSQRNESAYYLSEVDAMAQHSYEHMQCAIQMLVKFSSRYNTLLSLLEYILDVYHNKEIPFDIDGDYIDYFVKSLEELKAEYRNRKTNAGNI